MPTTAPRTAEDLLDGLRKQPGLEERLAHVTVLPAHTGRSAAWPVWVAPSLRASLRRQGITELWSHQAATAGLLWDRRHVVLATGPGSGKSLAYHLPAITSALTGRGARGQRGGTTLYVSPTKALAADQQRALHEYDTGVRVTTYDGDSARATRDWARSHAEIVLTNPDMLHLSVLPHHVSWSWFLTRLRFVVIDECHHYRGGFGAHVAHIVRRLLRICSHYGATPTVLLASGTVADPAGVGHRLTGLSSLTSITEDGSPRARRLLTLWRPGPASLTDDGAAMLAALVRHRVKTLVFIASRAGSEQVALAAEEATEAGLVAAYRGGYLPEERRAIERSLQAGDLIGLAATNALELGVDVSGLDAVVVAGYPGTLTGLWQQLGRAGRGTSEALGAFLARQDPLDHYLLDHPERIFDPLDDSVFDPDNIHVLAPHLCAAAQEIPLAEADLERFGPAATAAVERLTAAGALRRRPRGWYWTDPRSAAALTDIRAGAGAPVRLVEELTGRVIGTVDADQAQATAHPGAVYVHRGESWEVSTLDLADRVAQVRPTTADHTTRARRETEISVLALADRRELPGGQLCWGRVRVTRRVTSFRRLSVPEGRLLGDYPLALPARSADSVATWWSVPVDAMVDIDNQRGAIHAARHAAIGLLPLVVGCDRADVTAVSAVNHPDVPGAGIFVIDNSVGGAGFAERAFARADGWLAAVRDVVSRCPCESGCPACIHSPSCSGHNRGLSKSGAIQVLVALTT